MGARKHQSNIVNWENVERTAFSEHPNVLTHLRSPKKKNSKLNWLIIPAVPFMLFYIFCYTAPIWGLAAISDSRYQTYRQDPAEQIPLAAVMFGFAGFLLLVSLIHWVLFKRTYNGFYSVQAGLALTLGGLTSMAVAVKGHENSIEDWQLWNIPVIASTALGAFFALLLFLAYSIQKKNGTLNKKPLVPLEEVEDETFVEKIRQIRNSVAELSMEEKAAVEAKIARSINRMERRGTITEEEAKRARRIKLGELGLRMKYSKASQ